MSDNITRRSTQRSQKILNMVPMTPKIPTFTEQADNNNVTTSLKRNETKLVKVAPGDYVKSIYAKPYFMISNIFNTFCETQTSQDIQYILNEIDTTAFLQESHNPTTPNAEISYSIDLTCNEVMSLDVSPFFNDTVTYDTHNSPGKKSQQCSTLQDTINSTQCDFDSDDSVEDKDYHPSDTESDDSENDLLELRQKMKKPQITLNKKIEPSTATIKKSVVTPNFIDTVSNVEKITILHRARRSSVDFTQKENTLTAPILICNRRNTIDVSIQQNPTDDVCATNSLEPETSHLPQKRKKYNTTALQRKLDAKNKKRLERCVKTGCDEKCLKKCISQISEEDRKAINEKYWNMTLQEQHLYVNSHTTVAIPKRKTTIESKRKPKRTFFLKKLDGTNSEVCKIFFLTTLGFKKTNDRILHDIRIDCTVDRRGKHQKTPAFDRDLLTRHVESFNPLAPHYRREHAPLRRYLPSDLNIAYMHKDFCDKYPESKVSYELYRRHIKYMNISFTRLGNEECETCEAYALHKKETSHNQTEDCTICVEWTYHHDKYTKARHLYNEHKKIPQNNSEIYFSADLEKVIMLPRLESFKAVIFCQRLVAYNQTFAPLGKITTASKPLAVLWHDAIRGRKQEDIMSAFYTFFLRYRDVTNIHLWLDNCSAQNKNWLLYSLLVHLVNSDDIAAEQIVLYYFEPGHTFMSCDQVHHQVELAMKKKNKLYDFHDFEEAVASINNSKVIVKSLTAECFLNVPNYVSDRRIQNSSPRAYLKNISQVCFKRTTYDLMYKNSFDEDYTLLKFMNDKYLKNPNIMKLEFRPEPKGIDPKKKAGIIEKLSSIIPPHKMLFWKNLPTQSIDEDSIATASSSKNIKRIG